MKKLFAALKGMLLAPLGALSCLADEEPDSSAAPDTLVACFSCKGNTEAVARLLAQALSADLYVIAPKVPYTPEDLNYRNPNSRVNRERNNPAVRPEIAAGPARDMREYRTVYLGYPIWWGEAPSIINRFLESHDFSGKTIVPFCTSGGSGISYSVEQLAAQTDKSISWREGKRFAPGATADEIVKWLADRDRFSTDGEMK